MELDSAIRICLVPFLNLGPLIYSFQWNGATHWEQHLTETVSWCNDEDSKSSVRVEMPWEDRSLRNLPNDSANLRLRHPLWCQDPHWSRSFLCRSSRRHNLHVCWQSMKSSIKCHAPVSSVQRLYNETNWGVVEDLVTCLMRIILSLLNC